jgi:porphobilinogen deaminase
VVAAFGGNCALPLAAWAHPADPPGAEGLVLTALLALPDGSRVARARASAPTAGEAADTCVAALREQGADEILAQIGTQIDP